MHLLNDVVTLIPAANEVPLQQGTTSPTSVTSPTLACVPPGTFGGYTYGTVPAASMSCLQASVGGMMVNVLPGPLNGYNVGCMGTSVLTAPTNGYIYSVPTSPVSGITGTGIQTSCCQPSAQTTSVASSAARLATIANAYGVPHTTSTSTSADSSSTSGGSSPAPLSPAQT